MNAKLRKATIVPGNHEVEEELETTKMVYTNCPHS